MPYRLTPLVNDETYHVFNRGIASQPTFLAVKDYQRFILCLSYYQFKDPPVKLSRLLQLALGERNKLLAELESKNQKIVEILSFCLMPNHFHLLIKQMSDGGLSTFIKKVTDSYIRYFNVKNQRKGPMFQSAFKAVHIDNNEQLIHVSRYIHLNPLVSFVVKEANFISYPWSSLRDYLNSNIKLVNPTLVLSQFLSPTDYLKFILDQADYGKQLQNIKHLTLD